MTNTPESDTMKTLTQTAIEQGAIQPKRFEDFGTFNSKSILFHDEAQLLATFNAWSVQQGWKLVPIEPTEDMEYEGNQVSDKLAVRINAEDYLHDQDTAKQVYKAMLSASPLKG
jgi:hypothetical protein